VTNKDEYRHHWERQPGEPRAAYDYFLIYLMMGSARTIRKAAAQAGVTLRRAVKYSSRYRWSDRARAYDDWEQGEKRRAWEKERVAMFQRHAALGMDAVTKIASRVKLLDPLEIGTIELAKLLDVSVRVERMSRGDLVTGGQSEMSAIDQFLTHLESREATPPPDEENPDA